MGQELSAVTSLDTDCVFCSYGDVTFFCALELVLCKSVLALSMTWIRKPCAEAEHAHRVLGKSELPSMDVDTNINWCEDYIYMTNLKRFSVMRLGAMWISLALLFKCTLGEQILESRCAVSVGWGSINLATPRQQTPCPAVSTSRRSPHSLQMTHQRNNQQMSQTWKHIEYLFRWLQSLSLFPVLDPWPRFRGWAVASDQCNPGSSMVKRTHSIFAWSTHKDPLRSPSYMDIVT